MLYIAICDDDKKICEQIGKIIGEYEHTFGQKLHVDLFFNGEDLYERLAEGQYYDLIFLDIDMYRLDGIEISTFIRNTQKNETTQIVFISSNQDHALKLFAVRPLDFIVKPVSSERIHFCVDYTAKKKERHKTVFFYRVSGILKTVLPEDILYFQSDARKIFMIHSTGEDVFYGKLDEVESRLQAYPFLRIHQSVLVNYMWIQSIQKLDVLMKNDKMLRISYPKRKEVTEKLEKIRRNS